MLIKEIIRREQMNKTRLELSDSTTDAIVKMSEGNPGALSVCMQLLTKIAEIDPDLTMGGLSTLLLLDTLGIYGSEIWMLYKDVCGEDIADTITILRGYQLGFIDENKLRHAINNRGDGIIVDDVLRQV
ncbi:hypothetical protein LCGC14_1739770, partial [marine sediment metagenome]